MQKPHIIIVPTWTTILELLAKWSIT